MSDSTGSLDVVSYLTETSPAPKGVGSAPAGVGGLGAGASPGASPASAPALAPAPDLALGHPEYIFSTCTNTKPEVGTIKYIQVLDEVADNKDTMLHVISTLYSEYIIYTWKPVFIAKTYRQ